MDNSGNPDVQHLSRTLRVVWHDWTAENHVEIQSTYLEPLDSRDETRAKYARDGSRDSGPVLHQHAGSCRVLAFSLWNVAVMFRE